MKDSPDALLTALRKVIAKGGTATSSALAAEAGMSWTTTKRHLDQLVLSGLVVREGRARATRYRLAVPTQAQQGEWGEPDVSFDWSEASLALRGKLNRPPATRQIVTYRRDFVEHYIPNESSLLPTAVATALANEGRMREQQPAGTYARKVLEPLLIDLSWWSSRLEGNRYSLLETRELFQSGVTDGDRDAVMLLNHKAAIEFLVDAVPQYGLSGALLRNLHATLMRDLLADTEALGTVRRKLVSISDTTYVPNQVPSVLEEMLELIVHKAQLIKNPVESAFFLWVNLAYLQPFEDGNKRTSRLAANVPLMLYNCAPLSFLDVNMLDYAQAMIGIYEFTDTSLAADLFAWAYRRSIQKYAVVLEATHRPDPVRLRFREHLNEAIRRIVKDRIAAADATASLQLTPEELSLFQPLLLSELQLLNVHNCARYRLTLSATQAWVDAGRPR
ncbi:Fic family protein [Dyella choica]|uniref:Fic family protein n=1 Tax=Dyella choica TaxID=1927959 RepID=A0A3S0PKW3_9GAMM|nr:Fic family protein [Dyella choica]RUL73604.1 Fic family protein [Dyella choica]